MGEILRKKPQTFTQHFGLCSSVLCQTWKRKDVAKILECGRRGYYKFGFNQGEEFWKAERKQQFGSNSAPSGKIPPLTPLHEIISVAFLQADSRSAWLVRLALMLR